MSGARCRRHRPEAAIQRAVCDHLRLRAKPDVVWLHCPNGERRDKITGAKLKRMGVLAGASDLLFWHNGNSFALELKAPGVGSRKHSSNSWCDLTTPAGTPPSPKASTARSRASKRGISCEGTRHDRATPLSGRGA